MNAIQLLRRMHADTKVSFKLILGDDDADMAGELWETLQPLLTLHEQLEDEFLYSPLQAELPAGTLLGDWEVLHAGDVAAVTQLVKSANQLEPGTPAWRMGVGRVMDALNKHVTDEEGQIFPRIEQIWDAERLDRAAQQMQKLLTAKTPAPLAQAGQPARRKR